MAMLTTVNVSGRNECAILNPGELFINKLVWYEVLQKTQLAT